LHGVVRQQVTDRLQSAGQAGDDLRPVAGQRLRHVFIGGTLARPLGVELRIGLIGLGQGLGEAFRLHRGRGKRDANQRAKANAGSKHAPSHVANSSGTPNHLIPQQLRPSAPAYDLDTSTCLGGGAATGKRSRDICTSIQSLSVAGSSQTNMNRKSAMVSGGWRPIPGR